MGAHVETRCCNLYELRRMLNYISIGRSSTSADPGFQNPCLDKSSEPRGVQLLHSQEDLGLCGRLVTQLHHRCDPDPSIVKGRL